MTPATPEAGASVAPDSSGPAERLAAILRAQAVLFDELAELSRRQRAALLDADVRLLEESTLLAEEIATRFRLLEDERQNVERIRPADQLATESAATAAALTRSREALARLVHEDAVSTSVAARLGDSVDARHAAIASMFGATYLADGTQAALRAPGLSISREG